MRGRSIHSISIATFGVTSRSCALTANTTLHPRLLLGKEGRRSIYCKYFLWLFSFNLSGIIQGNLLGVSNKPETALPRTSFNGSIQQNSKIQFELRRQQLPYCHVIRLPRPIKFRMPAYNFQNTHPRLRTEQNTGLRTQHKTRASKPRAEEAKAPPKPATHFTSRNIKSITLAIQWRKNMIWIYV